VEEHFSGALLLGRLLDLPANIRLGWKSLLRTFVNYGRKKFYNIGHTFFYLDVQKTVAGLYNIKVRLK